MNTNPQNNTLNSTHDSNSHSSTQLIENNSHPLYLNNNDQSCMILISKKLLGSGNYASWKSSMQISLSAKNKLVIVTGDFLLLIKIHRCMFIGNV